MIDKVLIANRGEIAVRILRGCEKLGIPAVTVYSDADKEALHTKLSKESYNIGPPPVVQSYLKMDKIIEVAKESNANAIHPGYGLLAENAIFAAKCRDNGITFIGPTPESINNMGFKVKARKIMRNAGIDVVPGTSLGISNFDECKKVAEEIGYPLMIKASAGGGGIGMQIVTDDKALERTYKNCQTLSKTYFGDNSLYIEKYLENSRHIEIQILADDFGNVIHLNERECSIQRRNQKVIEESPSPLVDSDLRERMGDVAKKAAKAINYTNAGTVEFLVDKNKKFYFLEMNTRLQVEHPVTEMTTGVDMVEQQLKIANNEKLSLSQEDIGINGHSIECRIYAEDPKTFFPSPGKINSLTFPNKSDNVRVDEGIYENYTVTPFYDPLLAKLITWDDNRRGCIRTMCKALADFKIIGIKTNIQTHQEVLSNRNFIKGKINTNFISNLLKEK